MTMVDRTRESVEALSEGLDTYGAELDASNSTEPASFAAVFVSCLGFLQAAAFGRVTDEEWRANIAATLTSIFVAYRTFVPTMCEHDGDALPTSPRRSNLRRLAQAAWRKLLESPKEPLFLFGQVA